jgi:phage shock protein A
MLKRVLTSVVSVVLVAVVTCCVSPAARTKITSFWTEYGSWTEEARRADPVGFASYASTRLEQDLEKMQRARRELSGEIGNLSANMRNQQTSRDQARQLAEEFRAKYQVAVAANNFPIKIHNASYTQSQAKAQASMILAEISGHDAALVRVEKVRKQAETQLEALTMRVNSCESQLAALSTQQEMLHARELTEQGERLLAQVDRLLDENTRSLEDNPVRTVRELLDTGDGHNGSLASADAVESFLAEKPSQKPQIEANAIPESRAENDANTEHTTTSTSSRANARPNDRAITVEAADVAMFLNTNPSMSIQQQMPVKKTSGKTAKSIFQQF